MESNPSKIPVGEKECASRIDDLPTSGTREDVNVVLSNLKNLTEHDSSNDTVKFADIKEETVDPEFGFWENDNTDDLETPRTGLNEGLDHSDVAIQNEDNKSATSQSGEKGGIVKLSQRKKRTKKSQKGYKNNSSPNLKTRRKRKDGPMPKEHYVVITGTRSSHKNAPDGIHDVEGTDDPSSAYYGYQKLIENGHVKGYFCKLCQRAYGNTKSQNLKVHINMQHRAEKMLYVCEYCAKAFYSARSLAWHVKMHKFIKSGEKFPCDQCDFETVSEKYLRKHKRQHHPDPSEVRMFFCDQCGYSNSLEKNLTRHISRVHQTYVPVKEHFCTWEGCNKRFRRPTHLKVHMCIHTGEKPFKCKHCDYAAIQQNSLMWHMKSCHPDIPYEYTYRKSLAESKKAQLETSFTGTNNAQCPSVAAARAVPQSYLGMAGLQP